jgi:hypothetical protein
MKDYIDTDWLSVTHSATDFKMDLFSSGWGDSTVEITFNYIDPNGRNRILEMQIWRHLTNNVSLVVRSEPSPLSIDWFLGLVLKDHKKMSEEEWFIAVEEDVHFRDKMKETINKMIEKVTQMAIF